MSDGNSPAAVALPTVRTAAARHKKMRKLIRHWPYYLFMLPTVAYYLVFHYFPLYGLQIAFKDYVITKGIWGSPWAGLEHFIRFFHSYFFWTLMSNTFLINLYGVLLFPLPILLALSLNELKDGRFKRWVQTITYAPHFISVVVVVGMIIAFLNPARGIVNKFIVLLGGHPVAFLTNPAWFKTVYVLSDSWQGLGWGAILYLAALAGIDPQLHESAKVDGASRLRRIWHINIPGILPTIVILLILNLGHFMSVGFEKLYLLQNPLNLDASDVISTYVYRSGLLQAEYSFSTAIGLFNNVINFVLLIAFNQIARKVNETSLW